jgi:transposase-like protein
MPAERPDGAIGSHERPHCSFCGSDNVERIAAFGTAQLVRQYYCNNCHSVFEYIRWQDEDKEAE